MLSRKVLLSTGAHQSGQVLVSLPYSMVKRDKFESEFHYIFHDYKYGSTIWSPLCQGILTGKYNDGSAPEGSRFEKDGNGATF